MKCSLFHAVEPRISLGRMFATLVLLACTISAQANDLLDVIQTKDATVSKNEEYGSLYGWQLSTNEDYMPGWMATEEWGESYLRIESSKQYTIAFDYVATIEDAGYLSYNFDSNSNWGSDNLYLSTEPRTFSISLESGWCSFNLYYENYNSDNQIYIYNFRIIACDHKGDTSEPTSHVDATCKHGSYDVHVCTECGVKYNTAPANDKLGHVDADQDHYCDVCGDYTHPDADKDGLCDIEDCGQVAFETIVKTYDVTLEGYSSCDGFVLSTNDNYKPGLMSGPARYRYEDEDPDNGWWESHGNLCLYFESDLPCKLSFDYVATAEFEDGYFSFCTSEDYRDEELSLRTTPQTVTLDFPEGGGYSVELYYNFYGEDAPQLYIYNIRIVACDHSGDTGEPTRHVEATCAQGSHDVYTCSICGYEYDGPEANDRLKHTDADDDTICDVCGAPILEKMFEVSEGIEMNFDQLDGTRTWNAFESSLSIGLSTGHEDWGTGLITITSPKDFTLSFDYNYDEDTWDEWMGYAYVSFSVQLFNESGKGAWNTGMVEPIEYWYGKGSATCDLPAGTYYLYFSASISGYRGSGDAWISNLKALYIESAIEKKAQDYQRFIMNHEELDAEDSGIEDLNEDGKISVGDITIAIDRALKDEESGE